MAQDTQEYLCVGHACLQEGLHLKNFSAFEHSLLLERASCISLL